MRREHNSPLSLSSGGRILLSWHTLKYSSCLTPGSMAPFGMTMLTAVSFDSSTPPLWSNTPRAVATTVWPSNESSEPALQQETNQNMHSSGKSNPRTVAMPPVGRWGLDFVLSRDSSSARVVVAAFCTTRTRFRISMLSCPCKLKKNILFYHVIQKFFENARDIL